MVSHRRSISFEESVLQDAERRLAESGETLSEFVNAAVRRELQVARGLELLAEDEAQFGPVSAEVKAQIAAEWPLRTGLRVR